MCKQCHGNWRGLPATRVTLGFQQICFAETPESSEEEQAQILPAFQVSFRSNADARNHRTYTHRILAIAFIKSVLSHRGCLGTQASVHMPIVVTHHLLQFQGSVMRNGYSGNDGTVADIKERAKERAFLIAATQGISATSIMHVAQDSAFEAQRAEDSGDLKKSLGLWVQASSLLSALFNAADFKAEAQPGNRGAVYKEVTEWMQVSALVMLCFEQSRGRNPRSTSRATHRVSSTGHIALNPS